MSSDEKETKGETKGEAEEPTLPVYLHEVFGQLAEKERLADVVFHVGDKKIPAHRLILAASSPLFEAMLYARNTDGSPDPTLPKAPLEVKIRDGDPAAFSAMLQCIYNDSVDVSASNIQALIKIAGKYQVEKLRALCAEFMEGDVNKDNVLDLFQIAPTMLGDEEFGLKFIEENAADVLASDGITKLSKERFAVILKDDKLAVEEIEVFKALQRWAEAEVKRSQVEGSDVKSISKDLIKLIRFPTMEINQVATIVAPSGLLEQSQLVGLFSYVSVTDEKVRALLPDPGFPTTPREGGSGTGFAWSTTKKGRYVTLSNKDLTAQTSGSSWNYGLVLGNKEFKNGNHYWEVKIDHSTDDMVGVVHPSIPHDVSSAYSSYASQCWFVHHGSGTYGGSVGIKSSLDCGVRTGDTLGIGLTFNKTSSTFDMTVYKNKRLVGTPFRNIPTPVVAAMELYSSPARATLDPKAKKPS